MTLVARVDASVCSAHGDCEDIAPEAFRIDDVAVVIGEAADELLMASAQACPVTAITLVNRDTGQQVYP